MIKNLSLGLKFALVSMAYTVPILTLFYLLISANQKDINFSSKELAGTEYISTLGALQAALTEHALNEQSLAPDQDLRAQTQEEISSLFDEAVEKQSRLGSLLDVSGEQLAAKQKATLPPAQLRDQWQALLLKPELNLRLPVIQGLSTQVRELIAYIGDTSNLILDPDLDSFYLMEAMVLNLPSLFSEALDWSLHTHTTSVTNNVGPIQSSTSTRPSAAGEDISSALGKYKTTASWERSVSSIEKALMENSLALRPNKQVKDSLQDPLAAFKNHANLDVSVAHLFCP